MRSPVGGGGAEGPEWSCQPPATSAATRATAASRVRCGPRTRVNTYATASVAPANTSAIRAGTAAYGNPPMSRAQPASYAASQPLTQVSAYLFGPIPVGHEEVRRG